MQVLDKTWRYDFKHLGRCQINNNCSFRKLDQNWRCHISLTATCTFKQQSTEGENRLNEHLEVSHLQQPSSCRVKSTGYIYLTSPVTLTFRFVMRLSTDFFLKLNRKYQVGSSISHFTWQTDDEELDLVPSTMTVGKIQGWQFLRQDLGRSSPRKSPLLCINGPCWKVQEDYKHIWKYSAVGRCHS